MHGIRQHGHLHQPCCTLRVTANRPTEFLTCPTSYSFMQRVRRVERTDQRNSLYENSDDNPCGPWLCINYTCNQTSDESSDLYLPILTAQKPGNPGEESCRGKASHSCGPSPRSRDEDPKELPKDFTTRWRPSLDRHTDLETLKTTDYE